MIREAQYLSAGRAGGAHQPLVLKGCDHIRELAQAVLGHDLVAHPAKARRKNDRPDRNLQRFFRVIKADCSSLAGHGAETAGVVIQLQAGFRVNVVRGRHGLRIVNVRGVIDLHVLVEIVADLFEAVQRALAAAGTDFFVNIARLLPDRGREIAGRTLQLDQLGERQYLNVRIAAGLNQLGREDAERAVVGGKGLVQAGHDPADGS